MAAVAQAVPVVEQADTRQKVLCVDDEKNILASLVRLFRKSPFDVLTANSGLEALDVLSRERIDLVISDMRMPHMDGAELLARVAERWPQTIRILLTGYSDMEATVTAINKGKIYRYLSKPWDETDLKMTVQRGLESVQLEQERLRLIKVTVEQNEELKSLNSSLEEKVEGRTRQLQRAYRDTISVFSQIAELREGTTAGHGKRVADLSIAISKALRVPENDFQDIRIAASLHDIGKLGLADEVVSRARTQLNKAQFIEYKKHTIAGPAILMSLPHLQNAAAMIRSHHEHFDGGGFPDGFRADASPFGARVIKVANDFDNYFSGKKTGEALADEESVREIMEESSGAEYDPTVLDGLRVALASGFRMEPITAANRLNAEELQVGMRLAKDLLTREGLLLLTGGHELTEALIERLRGFENDYEKRLEIFVQTEEAG